jgi:hypothetical protein
VRVAGRMPARTAVIERLIVNGLNLMGVDVCLCSACRQEVAIQLEGRRQIRPSRHVQAG